MTPPLNQPIQKSYKDWNTSWPQNSWTITEPAIYTQASYLRLISQFINASSPSQIKTVIQGFYNSSTNRLNRKDTVRAFLRNIFSPYNIIDSSKSNIDSVTFTGNFLFANASSGTYYIVLKHRNSIETWSKSGGEVYNSGTSFSFNFNSDSSQAYGMNMIRVSNFPLTYAIYNGDVNQDNTIDASDLSLVENDVSNSVSGYVKTDITGDDFADAGDLSIAENNSANSVGVIIP